MVFKIKIGLVARCSKDVEVWTIYENDEDI